MSELTNIHARAAKDLTTPTNLPADPNALDQVKLVAGNFPKGLSGSEALTVEMVKKLAAQGRDAELAEVFQKITQEETRAKKVEAALINDKANKATTLSGYGISDAYTQGQIDSKVNNLESKKANKVAVDAAFSNLNTTANKYYSTLAAANADIANIVLNQSVTIGEAANSGLWYKATAGATSLTKSPYDPLTQAYTYTDNKVKSVTNNFKTKALMEVSTLPNDSYAMVTEDTEANNGRYSKVEGAWVKTAYDPYNMAVEYTDKETALSKDATANLLRGLQASELSIKSLDDENTKTLDTFKVQTDLNTSTNRAIQGVAQSVTTFDTINKAQTEINTSTNRAIQGVSQAVTTLNLVDKAQTELSTSTNRAIQGVSQVVTTLDSINKETEFSNLYHKSRELVELAKLDGFDTEDSDVSAKPILDNTYVFGEPRGLIRIDMNMPYVPRSKADGDIEGTVKVNVDGEILSSHAIFSVQGASSAAFRKKNLNVEFCTDDTYDTDIFLKIGDIRPHAKWVYKANFIDHSQVRNLTGYRLWKQLQDQRTGYPAKDIDNYYVGKTGVDAINTQASGHPDGATCVTYVNGQFYGLGTFLIGKRNENYNLDKNNPNHIAFNFAPGDDQDVTIRLLMNELEEGTFELRHPKKYTPLVTQRFAEFAAVNDLPQAEFEVAARNVLDTRNVVDFYLHNNMIGNWDAQVNNTQCVTWDGVRWYFFPYDLDQIFVKGTMNGDIMKKTKNGFYWIKVYNTYETEILARYAELRKTIFTLKNFDDLFKRITSSIPLEFYLAEQEKWGGELVSHTEYMEWVRGRLANLDTVFDYTETN